MDENSLFKIQYGMYVISTAYDGKINGQIATTLMQVTYEPIQISVCLSKTTYTHELISKSKKFSASVLEQDTPMKFIGNFGFKSGRDIDKFTEINYDTKITNCPLITDHTIMNLEAEVVQQFDIGTHTIFIGRLLGNYLIKEGDAMTYEYYHTVIRGKSPEGAPTHISKNK
ncbi:MAG: flavin reductase [Gammaproteobacteria bacterium]|nr:flavin reductase [Gammaproteobacteria bacterium]